MHTHTYNILTKRALGVLLLFHAHTLAGCIEEDPTEELDPHTLWKSSGELYPGGETTEDLLLGSNAFIPPAENISTEHEMMFFSGNSFFNQAWVQAPASTKNRDGLGPLFNARSCSACHFKDGRGEPPTEINPDAIGLLLRLSVPGEDEHGGPMHHATYGNQLQPLSLPDVLPEADFRIVNTEVQGTYADGSTYTLHKPSYVIENYNYGEPGDDLMVSPRIAPQMIGLGLLEAIPEERLLELADPDDTDNDGISGKVQRVWSPEAQQHLVGRFGWKGDAPTVRQQVAGAFLGDMGITSPVNRSGECNPTQMSCLEHQTTEEMEIDPGNFDRVVVYSSLLAVPVRKPKNIEQIQQGKELFSQANCAACHTPSHITGNTTDLKETHDQLIWPYTDLLLHDMGEELADHRPVFEASGREWKTPPLWGTGRIKQVNKHQRLLHDGRADGVEEAILWHGGEAAASRDAFKSMTKEERDALVAFVDSL